MLEVIILSTKLNIYSIVENLSSQYTMNDIKNNIIIGFSAEEIGCKLGIKRNTASAELNKLYNEGYLIKIKGKPVRFIARESIERILNIDLNYTNQGLEVSNINDIINLNDSINDIVDNELTSKDNVFTSLIGYNSSLFPQIEQAKASILYPGGLDTLITGPSGVGKTYFAELMYEYAKFRNIIDNDKPFVSFNCAEYADNPQLLVSHLFGHVKGAFTGADDDKEGLVEKANNGILFLDEIHRLPEEGQEILFYLMDKGIYRKMGETKGDRKAKVRIIGATTKDPEYTFLKTFLRRIPIIIRIPSLDERPLEEKYQLIITFFSDEAERIGKKIVLKRDVLRTLLQTKFEGNIGELRGEIQFICARGFIKSIQKDTGSIVIDNRSFLGKVKYNINASNAEIDLTLKILKFEDELVISPIKNKKRIGVSNFEQKTIYDRLESNYNFLIKNGHSQKDALDNLIGTVNDYFKDLLIKFENIEEAEINLLRIIPQNIYNITNEFLLLAEKELSEHYGKDILLSLSLHIQSFIERSKTHKPINNPNLENIKINYPEEFMLSVNFIKQISEYMDIEYSEDEAGFVTMFLNTASKNVRGKIGTNTLIILLSHGLGVATSTKKLINQLMGDNIIEGIDMPIDMGAKELLANVIKLIDKYGNIHKLLLMVDMGSLSDLAEKIWIHYDKRIEVGIITGVNTLMLLDVSRKVYYTNTSMDKIIGEVNYSDYLKVGHYPLIENGKKRIIASCLTGIGTAVKIKEMLEDIIHKNIKKELAIDAIEFSNLKENKNLENVICIVGTFDPHISYIPFIPLEDLLSGRGIDLINEMLKENEMTTIEDSISKNSIIQSLSMDLLIDYLTFLNPAKTIEICTRFLEQIERTLNIKFDNPVTLRFIIHTACMIERIISNEEVLNTYSEHFIKDSMEYSAIDKNIRVINNNFRINVPDTEISFLYEILFTN